MSLALDTTELEARLEQRIAERVVREVSRLLENKNNGGTADRWLRLKEVAALIGRSKRTVDDMAKRGDFPRWATVLHGAKLWRESDVVRWMRECEEKGQS